MILSDLDIRKLNCFNSPIIEPFDESNLQAVSYDLTLGTSVVEFDSKVRTINLANQSAIDSIYHEVQISTQGYTLQPGQYVLASVAQTISIPVSMCAHIRPRTRFTRLGLLVSSQHCQPGYSGKLTLGIYNASPNAIILTPQLRIAQIIFEELKSEPSKEKQYQNKDDAAYMNETSFKGSVFAEGELSPGARVIYESLLKQLED